MTHQPIIIERLVEAPINVVWKAITDKYAMQKWYFDFDEFVPEVGFKFEFKGGPEDGTQYVHLCEITEIIICKKLTYSWRYEGYEGNSFVTFDLTNQMDKTLVRLIHEGVETFDQNNPDFARENFVKGWTEIINTSLVKYLDTII